MLIVVSDCNHTNTFWPLCSMYLCLSLNKFLHGFFFLFADARGRKTGEPNWMFYSWFREKPNSLYFNQILSTISYTQKMKNEKNLLNYFVQVTKITRNKSQLFKEATWVITLVCHWLPKFQASLFVLPRRLPLPFQYKGWVVFFR